MENEFLNKIYDLVKPSLIHPISFLNFSEYYKQEYITKINSGKINRSDLINWLINKLRVGKTLKYATDLLNILHDYNWVLFIKKLTEYKKKFGNCNVPGSYKDKWLANRVIYMRAFYKKGKLSNDMIDQLNSLGFIWNPIKKLIEINPKAVHSKSKMNYISEIEYNKRTAKILGDHQNQIKDYDKSYNEIKEKMFKTILNGFYTLYSNDTIIIPINKDWSHVSIKNTDKSKGYVIISGNFIIKTGRVKENWTYLNPGEILVLSELNNLSGDLFISTSKNTTALIFSTLLNRYFSENEAGKSNIKDISYKKVQNKGNTKKLIHIKTGLSNIKTKPLKNYILDEKHIYKLKKQYPKLSDDEIIELYNKIIWGE